MTARHTPVPESSALPASSPRLSHGGVRRIVRFGLVVAAILLGVNAFVCATWSHFSGMRGWLVWQAIPGALVVGFITSTIVGFRFSNPLLRIVYAVSASWLGALNFAFFAAVACWMADAVAGLAGWPWPRLDIAATFFGAALLATVYGLINAAWLRVTRVTIHLPNLPEAWTGRTVALVTDLHLGHLSGPGFLRRVIARLRSLRPDAVLISGDMFDGSPIGLDRLVAPWREFSAPKGIYYVTGNHDEFAERAIYWDAVKRTGIRVLHNEKISVDGLQLIGVHDSEAGDPQELRRILREAQIDPRQASVLLAHQPANLAVAEEEGVSLQVSGHTHRGQMWPWNLLVTRIWGRFAYGLNRLGGLQVYTSSGAGTWGPPLRVGTKAEIVLIRFTGES
jgi:predicted MPP superfamily phosphohydrolase